MNLTFIVDPENMFFKKEEKVHIHQWIKMQMNMTNYIVINVLDYKLISLVLVRTTFVNNIIKKSWTTIHDIISYIKKKLITHN